MVTDDKASLLRDFLAKCSRMFLDIPGNLAVEQAVSWPFQAFPTNTDLGEVLPKVVLLNSLYATGIIDTQRMARHICSLGQSLDEKLGCGDPTAVDDIRIGHRICRKSGTECNFYSFATKYLHWHEPDRFPIFDNLISRVLPILNECFGFYRPFGCGDLRYYPSLIRVLDALIVYVDLPDYRFKHLDKGLWVYGKVRFTHDLPEAMTTDILQAEQRLLRVCA